MEALMEQMGKVLGFFSESVTRESSVVEPVFHLEMCDVLFWQLPL